MRCISFHSYIPVWLLMDDTICSNENIAMSEIMTYPVDWTQFAGAWPFVGPWLFKTFLTVYRQIICLPFPIPE